MASLTLESWDSLTRSGTIPPMVVIRPILFNGETLPIGAEFTPDPTLKSRTRQFYEQRKIAPKDTVASEILALGSTDLKESPRAEKSAKSAKSKKPWKRQ